LVFIALKQGFHQYFTGQFPIKLGFYTGGRYFFRALAQVQKWFPSGGILANLPEEATTVPCLLTLGVRSVGCKPNARRADLRLRQRSTHRDTTYPYRAQTFPKTSTLHLRPRPKGKGGRKKGKS